MCVCVCMCVCACIKLCLRDGGSNCSCYLGGSSGRGSRIQPLRTPQLGYWFTIVAGLFEESLRMPD